MDLKINFSFVLGGLREGSLLVYKVFRKVGRVGGAWES
jgi:hypothetical protein